jgi:uncharacterized protein (TIGR02301 family)
MKGASVFAGAGVVPRQALRAIAVAAICIAISTTLAASPFDFLFGGPPAATPPPAEAKPSPSGGNNTQHGKVKHPKTKPKKAAAKPAPDAKAARAPEAEPPPPPYDPEILRLAEILGALTYLDILCASNPPGDWRAKMQALLEAEAKTEARKERLAGSYNRGFHDYERTYHLCTPNAQAIIGRFLAEGGKIAHEVVNRYGAS